MVVLWRYEFSVSSRRTEERDISQNTVEDDYKKEAEDGINDVYNNTTSTISVINYSLFIHINIKSKFMLPFKLYLGKSQ